MAKKRYVHKTARPATGGKLIKTAAAETAGISNYVEKLNFRRDQEGELRREGWGILPNGAEINDTDGFVRLLHEFIDHSGEPRLVASSGSSLYAYVPNTGTYYMADTPDVEASLVITQVSSTTGAIENVGILNAGYGYQDPVLTMSAGTAVLSAVLDSDGRVQSVNIDNAGTGYSVNDVVNITNSPYAIDLFDNTSQHQGWKTIATGLHYLDDEAKGVRRWECVEVSGYCIFNNGYDLPLIYKSGWDKAHLLYGIRENSIASVGTIQSYDGRLVCADIAEITTGIDIVKGHPSGYYGCVYDMDEYNAGQIATTRNQYSMLWSGYGEPWLFNQSLSGYIDKNSNEFIISDYAQSINGVASTIKVGDPVHIAGAGINGDKLSLQLSGNSVVAGISGEDSNNEFTKTDHKFASGDKVRVTYIEGVGPLNGSDYYIAEPTDDTFKLTGSRVKPASAVAVYSSGKLSFDITDGGSGYTQASPPVVSVLGISGITIEATVNSLGQVSDLVYTGIPASTGVSPEVTIAYPVYEVVNITTDIPTMSLIKPDLTDIYEGILEGRVGQVDTIQIKREDGLSQSGSTSFSSVTCRVKVTATASQTVTIEHDDNSVAGTPPSGVLQAHGLSTGDVVNISGLASALDGIPIDEINKEHVVTKVDDDTYTILVKTESAGTATEAVVSIEQILPAKYEVNIGRESYSLETGKDMTPKATPLQIATYFSSKINTDSSIVTALAYVDGLDIKAKLTGEKHTITVNDNDANGSMTSMSIRESSLGDATVAESNEAYLELYGEAKPDIPDGAFAINKPLKVEGIKQQVDVLYIHSMHFGNQTDAGDDAPTGSEKYAIEFIIDKGLDTQRPYIHEYDYGAWYTSHAYVNIWNLEANILASTPTVTTTHGWMFAYATDTKKYYAWDSNAGSPAWSTGYTTPLASWGLRPLNIFNCNFALIWTEGLYWSLKADPLTAAVGNYTFTQYTTNEGYPTFYSWSTTDGQLEISNVHGPSSTYWTTGTPIAPVLTAVNERTAAGAVNLGSYPNYAPPANWYSKVAGANGAEITYGFYIVPDEEYGLTYVINSTNQTMAGWYWWPEGVTNDSYYYGHGIYKWKPESSIEPKARDFMKRRLRLNAHATTSQDSTKMSRSIDNTGSIIYDYDLGSGYQDWQEDGSPIIKMEQLGEHLACYRSGGYFLTTQSGKVANPFSFRTRYVGRSVPTFRNSIINVNNRTHYYAGHAGMYQLSQSQPEPVSSPLLTTATNFWEKVSKEESEYIFTASNPLTKEYFLCTQDRTYGIDYIENTVSEMDFVLTAASMARQPSELIIPPPNDLVDPWFIMSMRVDDNKLYEGMDVTNLSASDSAELFSGATPSIGTFTGNLQVRYGWGPPDDNQTLEANLGTPQAASEHRVYYRELKNGMQTDYKSILQSGLTTFGDTFNEKDMRTYILHVADNDYTGSPVLRIWVYTAYTTASPSSSRYAFGEDGSDTPITITDITDENTIPLYLRAPLYQDKIEVTGVGAQLKVLARTFEVAGVFDKSAHQVIGQGGFINVPS